MDKTALFQLVEAEKDRLFDLAWQIHDKPECEGNEVFAAQLLTQDLEARGFQVEKGVGGLETAFRATWSNGQGGPNVGILGEYDALEGLGHGCGHHMQTPAAIGAAAALQKALAGTDIPLTITIYGTPAEETFGGKIIMQDNGCFRELDAVLGSHATRTTAFVGGGSMALRTFVVTFHGQSAHAASSPHVGRSAADAMFLSFNGVEFMREHVKDGTRMHYTVKEALAPSNQVPDRAVASYTLRSRDNAYLDELEARFRKIIQGACLMTETEADIEQKPSFLARKKNLILAEVAKESLELLQLPFREPFVCDSGGSTDFGNVSCIVPGALVYIPYLDTHGHSPEWVEAGKSQWAEKCLLNSAKALAGILYDIALDPSIVERAKAEFDGN